MVTFVMTQVAIQLPDDLSRFVNKSVEAGGYHDADEFFVSVLSNYREQVEAQHSDADQLKLNDLRSEIQAGLDQLDRGEGVRHLDWDARLAERHRAYTARQSA